MNLFPNAANPARRLRARLAAPRILQAPGCFDGLSARVLEAAGFEAGFLGGFSVAAVRLGLPDVGLLSYSEMLDQARNVCAATALPIIGDADTGYGNAVNAERTLLGCARSGLACVMIEDQQWPKRCGHTAGKAIVERGEALARVRACARAREEHGLDIMILARTDACATAGFDEALWRCEAFANAGADITFLEAPERVDQMQRYYERVSGFKTANLVEDGKTPWLAPEELEQIGYSIVLYPVSLLLHGIHAMQDTCARLLAGGAESRPPGSRARFDEARALLGWPDYDQRLRSLEDTPTDIPTPRTSKA